MMWLYIGGVVIFYIGLFQFLRYFLGIKSALGIYLISGVIAISFILFLQGLPI